MIKVTIDKDFRCFKEGESFEFDFSSLVFPIIYIVGNNGTGKSTLLNAIRSKKHSIKNETIALTKHDFANVSVEGLDEYDKVFCLSSELDDPVNMYNAYDAVAFVENGGFGQRKLSNGQKSITQLGRFIEKLRTEDKESKKLIILDECDKGLDLKKQVGFNIMLKNMSFMFNADVLVVSHNPITWMCSKEVYSITDKKVVSSNEYIEKETGISNFINEIPETWSYK